MRRRGFTLLEIMVALAVLAIAMTLLLQTFSQGLRSAERTRHVTRQGFLARSLMEEAFLSREPVEGMENGTFPTDPGYMWERIIEPYEGLPLMLSAEEDPQDEAELEHFRIFRIQVRVRRSEGQGGGVTLESLRTFGPDLEAL